MRKTILAAILIAAMFFVNSAVYAEETAVCKAADEKFTDIFGHWAEAAINKVADKDTFTAKDGKFQPNKAITRSEYVLMLHQALGIKIAYFKATDIKEFFDDVNNEDIYASALYDLVITNIIDDRGHFYPDKTLNREEMVHYLMNAYKYKMGEKYKEIKISVRPFADDKQIKPSYSGEVYRAEYMGLLKRPANNKFYPKNDSTRAQAATVIYRLLNQLEKESTAVGVTPEVQLLDGIIRMKLTVTNNTDNQIVIRHTSGQKFDFQLLDSGRNVLYTWSADKMFIQALSETVIEPGQSVEFTGEVQKAVLDSVKAKAAYMRAYIAGESDGFKVNSEGYETALSQR